MFDFELIIESGGEYLNKSNSDKYRYKPSENCISDIFYNYHDYSYQNFIYAKGGMNGPLTAFSF